MKHHDIKDVKQKAQGRWHDILSALCPNLKEALSKPGHHVVCPIHGGKDDFRMFKDYDQTGGAACTCGVRKDGFDLLCDLHNLTLDQAITNVADVLGMNNNGESTVSLRVVPKPEVDPEKVKAESQKIFQRLLQVWNESYDASSWRFRPVFEYFSKRGLEKKFDTKVLRLHPSLPYYDEEQDKITGKHPTLIAKVQNEERRTIAIHRTYLTFNGLKADVKKAKKLMATAPDVSLKGSAIKLFEAGQVLGLSEGVENALAVNQVLDIPTWACISNILLEQVIVPKHVKYVFIFADKDRSGAGQSSANKLAKRLREEGFIVFVMIPHGDYGDCKGIDWLDMLNRFGAESFFDDFCTASLPNDFDVFESERLEPPVEMEVIKHGCC
jgi:hypothetical protein